MVKELLIRFFDAYLIRRDLEGTLSLLADNVISLGTGAQEVALHKEELRALMQSEFQMLPNGFRYELSNFHEVTYSDTVCAAYCGVMTAMPAENGIELQFQTRLTMTAALLDGAWKIVNLHMSTPFDQQEEEEFFPIKYGHQAVGKLEVSASKKLVEIMLSMLPGGIMGGYLEPGFPLYIINDTMLQYLGYTYEELVEETGEMMQKIIDPEDWERVETEIYKSLAQTGEYDVQYRVVRKDGTRLWVDDKGHEIVTEDGRRAIISVMLDINDSVALQERLRQEAMQDALTGLLNRKGMNLHMKKLLDEGRQGATILLDLDNFKQMNDTYGHQAGDRVLCALADSLRACAAPEDVAARIGGDEFMMFLTGCTDKDEVSRRAEEISAQFERTGAEYDKVALSVSIGAFIGTGAQTLDEMIKRADEHLYMVKKGEKGHLRLED